MSPAKLVRITITVPKALLAAADKLAGRLDRSRSWVLSQALKELVAKGGVGLPASPSAATREISEARKLHLATETALPPDERLRRAQDLIRLAHQLRPRSPRRQIIGFDSYEDFYEWKKGRLAGG